jgi:hypothetical protein
MADTLAPEKVAARHLVEGPGAEAPGVAAPRAAAPGVAAPRAAAPGAAAPGAAAPGAAERLHRAAAAMAGRLAVLLDRLDPGGGRAGFLHALAAEHTTTAAGLGGLPGAGVLGLPQPGSLHPVDRIASALGLDALDLDLLVLAGLPEEHEGLAAIARELHPDGRPAMTAGLALALAEAGLIGDGGRERARQRLAGGSVARSGLIRLDRRVPFPEASLAPGDGLWAVMRGEDAWPLGTTPLVAPVVTSGCSDWAAQAPVRAALAALAARRRLVVATSSERPAAAAARLAGLVALAGRRASLVALDHGHHDTATGRLSLVGLHAVARGTVPIAVVAAAGQVELDAANLHTTLGLCQLEGSGVRAWPAPVLRLPLPPLTRNERLSLQRSSFEVADLPEHPLGPATAEPFELVEVAHDLRAAGALAAVTVSARDVIGALDRLDAAGAPDGAVIVHPTATFDDLVVAGEVTMQLREALARQEHRETVLGRWGFLAGRPGREGLRMLFHGPPGTGKTLAGEVLAGALGRDLLVVDLSRIVSKWLGETEKHLAATFERAERSGCALFFDEADALFGRRTEVGDARDRYANLETAYLLSRIERYEGLVVLATNLRQNLDGAFTRRLDFVVAFDPPDAAQRLRLWRRLLPPGAPLDHDVELERVASLYAIPGGMIRGAALSAGYLAAADGSAIATRHLVHALRREYAKAGQHFPGEPHQP